MTTSKTKSKRNAKPKSNDFIKNKEVIHALALLVAFDSDCRKRHERNEETIQGIMSSLSFISDSHLRYIIALARRISELESKINSKTTKKASK